VDTDPARVRAFAEPHPFPTAVDSANVLGRLFDFDVVPNGLLIDEAGLIRFLHVGGFYLGRPKIRQQVDALLQADFAAGEHPTFVAQEPLELETIRGELAHRPDDPDLLLALGDALLRQDRAADAVAAFQRAAELRHDDWSVAFALGTALRRTGDQAGALSCWRRALELDPQNFTVRKQIWREEHPDLFYPTIDTEWQKAQLVKEGWSR
jgi:tetratricopeptide (TPR) repeat protein